MMADTLRWYGETLWLFLPAYLANASPVLLHGGGPLDNKRTWVDGKRIFGDHKTIYGTLSGIIVGTIFSFAQGNPMQGFLFSVGAILGDLAFAFMKRRMGLKPGQPLPLWDQVGFIIFAILFGSLVESRPTWQQDLAMIITTVPVHYITNLFAWSLRWKNHPW